MRFLLDTDTCIAAMRMEQSVVDEMKKHRPADFGVSTVTAYELYTGVEKCAEPARERTKVETLLNTLTMLSFDFESAEEAAQIRATLESTGQPIGPYDTLIAGQARVKGLTLVTSNTAEFARVGGLQIENWRT